MQLGQVVGRKVSRQEMPAVVRLGVRPRDHTGAAWGWITNHDKRLADLLARGIMGKGTT